MTLLIGQGLDFGWGKDVREPNSHGTTPTRDMKLMRDLVRRLASHSITVASNWLYSYVFRASTIIHFAPPGHSGMGNISGTCQTRRLLQRANVHGNLCALNDIVLAVNQLPLVRKVHLRRFFALSRIPSG